MPLRAGDSARHLARAAGGVCETMRTVLVLAVPTRAKASFQESAAAVVQWTGGADGRTQRLAPARSL